MRGFAALISVNIVNFTRCRTETARRQKPLVDGRGCMTQVAMPQAVGMEARKEQLRFGERHEGCRILKRHGCAAAQS
jgi:hypothetical protein